MYEFIDPAQELLHQTWVKYKHEYSNYKYKYPVHG